MSSRSGGLLAIALAVAAGACAEPNEVADSAPAATPPPVCAQIFSTNDTHGRLQPAVQSWSNGRPVGGAAAMAAYAAAARDSTPECPVFIVSGGDIMQGTLISNLTAGSSTISAFNAIGYDAVAIGNHEFDWGIDALRERIEEAEFALLGANIYERATGRHPAWVRPWTIVERGGVRVGFIGMTTRSTPTSTRPINVIELEFRSISEALDRYIPEVREAGADFVVAVMHEGGLCSDDGGCSGEGLDALRATTERYDYAVTGHTHSLVETEIRGVPVVQSRSNGTAFGLGRIDRGEDGTVSARLLGVRETYADVLPPDPAVLDLIAGFQGEVAHLVDRVVTRLEAEIRKPRRGDLVLGRIIADAQRAATGTQIALMNSGGVRRGLPAGDITYGTLFELQPFGNRLVTMELSGESLLEALEFGMKSDGAELQLSGVRVIHVPGAQAGDRLLRAELTDGTPVESGGRYTVTVNDFLSIGGSGFTMFLEGSDIVDTGIVDFDALVDYLEGQPRPFSPPSDGRWIPAGG